MIAEVLLVLAGHPSSFFTPFPPAPAAAQRLTIVDSLSELLHPGEVAALDTLAVLAFRYRQTRAWARDVCERTRISVLVQASGKSKGKGKAGDRTSDGNGGSSDLYTAALAASVLEILKEYELLVVETESRILQLDPGLVQDGRSYVPLSTLVAAFDPWQPVLAALYRMVQDVSRPPPPPYGADWTPGRLMDHLSALCETGHPRLRTIYTSLLRSVHALFLTHLIAFLLFGHASPASTPAMPALGLDTGPDPTSPEHRTYRLNDDLLPAAMSMQARESTLYIGRIAATMQRKGKSLPEGMVRDIRERIVGSDTVGDAGRLDQAILYARSEVGEWLWKTVLTGPEVTAALETFGDYFLLRKADFSLSLIREFHRLYHTKILSANPNSSSAVIREVDLNVATMRASVSTSAETDAALEKLAWKLEAGPLRPVMPPPKARAEQHQPDGRDTFVHDLFGPMVLGTPLRLRVKVGWPLDLFLTPATIEAYSDIHAYLFALRDAHTRLLDCWANLADAERSSQRRPTHDGPLKRDKKQSRVAWCTLRSMLFLLDQLLSHFTSDIIEVQHQRLLNQLSLGDHTAQRGLTKSLSNMSLAASMRGSLRHKAASRATDLRPESPSSDGGFSAVTTQRPRAPPTPNAPPKTYLDFLTIRQMHTRHLAFLRDGLLLTDRTLASLVRDILVICKTFAGQVSRRNSDSPPAAKHSEAQQEPKEAMRALSAEFNERLADFYRALLESQNPVLSKDDASSTGTGGTSFSRTARTIQLSRLMSRPASLSGGGGAAGRPGDRSAKDVEKDGMMSRHVEQLLLRLDFNGVLSSWIADEDEGGQSRNLLAEGGL